MAEIVAVYAVPHTPSFVAEVQVNGEHSQTAQFFSKIRSHLEAVKPDVIVTVNNDHFNTFFFDNWPTFAIGTASGPRVQTIRRPACHGMTSPSRQERRVISCVPW